MFDLIITGIVSMLSILICCGYLKSDCIKIQNNMVLIMPRGIKKFVFGFGLILSSISTALILLCVYKFTWVFIIKRIIINTVLWPIALIDYRKHIIQNKVLLFLLVLRIVIVIVEMVYDANVVPVELLNCLIAAICVLVLLCVMRILVKGGIGIGDIKLFFIIGLYFGIKGLITMLFMSFFVSFIISIFLLVAKKKTKKDQIAFAPAILVGTLLSTLFLGA